MKIFKFDSKIVIIWVVLLSIAIFQFLFDWAGGVVQNNFSVYWAYSYFTKFIFRMPTFLLVFELRDWAFTYWFEMVLVLQVIYSYMVSRIVNALYIKNTDKKMFVSIAVAVSSGVIIPLILSFLRVLF